MRLEDESAIYMQPGGIQHVEIIRCRYGDPMPNVGSKRSVQKMLFTYDTYVSKSMWAK